MAQGAIMDPGRTRVTRWCQELSQGSNGRFSPKERALQDVHLQAAERVGPPAGQVLKGDDRRAEEQRVDLVKLPAVALENIRKRSAMVGGRRRGHPGPDLCKQVVAG